MRWKIKTQNGDTYKVRGDSAREAQREIWRKYGKRVLITRSYR